MAETDPDFPIYDVLPDLEPPHRQRLFFGHNEEEQTISLFLVFREDASRLASDWPQRYWQGDLCLQGGPVYLQ